MISNNPFYISGRKKFEAQDYQGALADYNQAIESEENPSIYSERGVVQFYLKDLNKSLDDMNYAANLEPENPYRYSSRAFIKDAMGNTEAAIEDYEIAIKLDPEDSIAHNNLGLLQEKLGYMKLAKTNYKKADELADIDNLLERIQDEQSEDQADPPPQSTSHELRQRISLVALVRATFTTKDGFKEYVRFIKNGFRAWKNHFP